MRLLTPAPLRLALLGEPDPLIEDLINILPDYSTGDRLHGLFVNKLMGRLPGNYSQMFGTGPSFLSVFFPGYQASPLLPLLDSLGLDDIWWSDFSIAVLCQAIADMAASIRGQMLVGPINEDIAARNAALRARSSRAYAGLLNATFAPVSDIVRRLDPATAKAKFHDALLQNVQSRQLWFQAGQWTSPDWEVFNQYAKYMILGATDAEVDTLANELLAAGLPLPDVVKANNWRSYAEHLRNKPAVDQSDIRDAAAGAIQQTTYLPNFGGGMPAQMPNGNCYEFTANTQPGTRFRQPPSGSCFTGSTEVLDSEGRPVRLADLMAGQAILTRSGSATVGYIARPVRSGRTLYRLEGGGPVFTSTHPFINGAAPDEHNPQPTVLAVDPGWLRWQLPSLAPEGIGQLGQGAVVLKRTSDGGAIPATVEGLRALDPDGDDTPLYDVSLIDPAGRQEFWAGTDGVFYLVSPEFPVFGADDAWAIAVVRVFEGVLAGANHIITTRASDVVATIQQFGAGIFTAALDTALAAAPIPDDTGSALPIEARIEKIFAALATLPPGPASAVATIFDSLMATIGARLAASVALGWRDCRTLGGDVLAVTIFDLALAPTTPIPADTLVRLELAASCTQTSVEARMWDRRGRTNTRFHHYFDQVVHIALPPGQTAERLSFAVSVDDAPVATLVGQIPLGPPDAKHVFQSAPLVDSFGKSIGNVMFDWRIISEDVARQELAHSGLWTMASAQAYADALGAELVTEALARLDKLLPPE